MKRVGKYRILDNGLVDIQNVKYHYIGIYEDGVEIKKLYFGAYGTCILPKLNTYEKIEKYLLSQHNKFIVEKVTVIQVREV